MDLFLEKILDSKYLKSDTKDKLNKMYDDSKVLFATYLGEKVDFYDLLELRKFIFPLSFTSHYFSTEEYEDLVEKAKKKIKFYEKIKEIKEKPVTRYSSGEEDYQILKELLNDEIISLIMHNSKNFDVYLIDNSIAKVEWKNDKGDDAYNAFYTHQKIKPEAIELIARKNKDLRKSI